MACGLFWAMKQANSQPREFSMNQPWCLKLWPSLRNPAWRHARAAEGVLGPDLTVCFRPAAVRCKLDPMAMQPLKQGFLVDGLDEMPAEEIPSHYTYFDMLDVSRHGDNFTQTRLYRWMKAGIEAGRPVRGRRHVFDSDARIQELCQSNLDLLRSLQRNGYNYAGPDEICLGILADGSLLHMRRGTHRMAAAHILELPSVTGRVTHIDRRFAERATGSGPIIKTLRQAIQEVARQTLA